MWKVWLSLSTEVSDSVVLRLYMEFYCNGHTSKFNSSLTKYHSYEILIFDSFYSKKCTQNTASNINTHRYTHTQPTDTEETRTQSISFPLIRKQTTVTMVATFAHQTNSQYEFTTNAYNDKIYTERTYSTINSYILERANCLRQPNKEK